MTLPRRRFLTLAALAPVLLHPQAAWAQLAGGSQLEALQLRRSEEGLRLAYTARLELPRAIDDALHKGVPLYFVARAALTRTRWYWRDAVLARSQRQWRLSFQALSRQYRLSTGGLQQSFDSLAEALSTLARSSNWLLELRDEPQAGARYELAFELSLDTTQLPGPLQIGLGPGSVLSLTRTQVVPAAELLAPPSGS